MVAGFGRMGCGMKVVVGLLGIGVGAAGAQAGVVLQPVSASTDMGNFNTYEPVHAIDQSALVTPYVSGVTDFATYVPATGTVGGGNSFTTWYSASDHLTGHFDFGLGGPHLIDALALWADPQTAGQGVNQFTLLASNDPSFATSTVLGTYSATDGGGIANQATANVGQIFSFAPISASYVRMEILSNHGSTATTGIVEAAFEGVTPEPGMAGLVVAGSVGAFGAGRRRHRRG